MFSRKILLLSIFLVSLLAISAVSAADNATDDIASASDEAEEIGITEDNEAVSVENNEDALNSQESDVLRIDESNQDQVLQSGIGSTVEVLSASKVSEQKSSDVLGAVNKDSTVVEPVLKAKKTKVVKMKVNYKGVTKKIGKFKIKARLWKVPYAYGYTNYLDIELYKNGKRVSNNGYASKYLYKENGRWKWWPKWRHGGVNHSYHRYINDNPIKMIKVKFRY